MADSKEINLSGLDNSQLMQMLWQQYEQVIGAAQAIKAGPQRGPDDPFEIVKRQKANFISNTRALISHATARILQSKTKIGISREHGESVGLFPESEMRELGALERDLFAALDAFQKNFFPKDKMNEAEVEKHRAWRKGQQNKLGELNLNRGDKASITESPYPSNIYINKIYKDFGDLPKMGMSEKELQARVEQMSKITTKGMV